MAYYLSKYKGKYRLKAEIDLSTNDYPRDIYGTLEQNDVYIDCYKGRVYHYGRNVLEAYIPKLGVGRNILKDIGKRLNVNIEDYTFTKTKKDGSLYLDNTGKKMQFYDYDKYYEAIEKEGTIFNITESDEEVIFRFKAVNLEWIIEYLKPKTGGCNISPFSTRNLFKDKSYEIPLEDLNKYKEVTGHIDKSNMLLISKATKDFIKNIPKKYKQFKGKDINAEKKKTGLKGKEFIHSCDLWEDYIRWLAKNI